MPARFTATTPSLLTRIALALLVAGLIMLAVWIRHIRTEHALAALRIEEKRPSAIAMRAAETFLRELRGEPAPLQPEPKADPVTAMVGRWSLFPHRAPLHEQILDTFEEFVRACQLDKADNSITHYRLLYLKKAAEAQGRAFTPKDVDGTNDQTSRTAVRLWKWSFSSTMTITEVARLLRKGYANEAFTNSELRLALDEQLAPPAKRCAR